MRTIGITGQKRAGKDAAANFVLELADDVLDLSALRQGFADKLKLSFARVFYPTIGLSGALDLCNELKLDGNHVKLTGNPEIVSMVTGREALQNFGTEAHRDVFGHDFWLDAVLPEGRDDCDILVIPDVRFDNEAERVRAVGGELWHIVRPELSTEMDGHASEQELEMNVNDYVIVNDGSLDDLRTKVAVALASGA